MCIFYPFSHPICKSQTTLRTWVYWSLVLGFILFFGLAMLVCSHPFFSFWVLKWRFIRWIAVPYHEPGLNDLRTPNSSYCLMAKSSPVSRPWSSLCIGPSAPIGTVHGTITVPMSPWNYIQRHHSTEIVNETSSHWCIRLTTLLKIVREWSG